jgi:predicted DNA-binding WGR domain protein
MRSRHSCDLGIRDIPRGHYALAVLIDTAAHYANRDVFERYVSRPRILAAFGWRTLQVLALDWFQDRNLVLDRIEQAMKGAVEPASEPASEPELPLAPIALTEEAATAIVTTNPHPITAQHAPPRHEALEASSHARPTARRFEFKDGTSRKFWQIDRLGVDITVTFGRIGTQGQTQLKQFTNEPRALQEVIKLVAEKLKKGYTEVTH